MVRRCGVDVQVEVTLLVGSTLGLAPVEVSLLVGSIQGVALVVLLELLEGNVGRAGLQTEVPGMGEATSEG